MAALPRSRCRENLGRGGAWLFMPSILALIVVLIPGGGHPRSWCRRWLGWNLCDGFSPLDGKEFAIVDVRRRPWSATLAQTPFALCCRWWLVAVVGVLLLAGRTWALFVGDHRDCHGHFVCRVVSLLRISSSRQWCWVGAFALMVMMTSPWRRRRFALPRPLRGTRPGQGLPAIALLLIAIGRGEVFGVGLGGGVEKLHWLRGAHRLLAGRDWRKFGRPGGRAHVDRAVLVAYGASYQIGRQAIALDRVFAGLVAQGVALAGLSGVYQHGREPGDLAAKVLSAPDEPRWLQPFAQPDGAGREDRCGMDYEISLLDEGAAYDGQDCTHHGGWHDGHIFPTWPWPRRVACAAGRACAMAGAPLDMEERPSGARGFAFEAVRFRVRGKGHTTLALAPLKILRVCQSTWP